MAIINKPTIVKGEANEIDLSKSDLAAVSKVVNDSYFSDFNNWFKVAMEYESDTGDQIEMLIFDASQTSPKTNFEISDKSKNNWQIKSIIIMDFDGGYLKLQRGDLTVQNFDIALDNVGGDIGTAYTAFNYLTVLRSDESDNSDIFGKSVSISGDYIVVGAYYDDGVDNTKTDAGAAYVYKINGGGTITQLDILRPQSLDNSDGFGYSVAISGNYIVVGAPYDDYANIKTNSGAAYVYKIGENDTITQLDTLKPKARFNTSRTLDASDKFGESVSIDGNYIVIGATGDDGAINSKSNSGVAYVYKINGDDTLTLLNTLRPDGLDANDAFGYSVSISGNYIVVSAIDDNGADNGTFRSGAAYIFKINGDDTITLLDTLRPDEPEILGRFGWSVSIYGNYIVIGNHSDDGADNTKVNSGAVHMYKIGENDVITILYTLRPDELESVDNFGISVSINGNYIVIGADGDDGVDNSISGSGAAYVFKINGDDTLTLLDTLRPDGLDSSDNFGNSVSISGNYIVVGTPYDNGANNSKSYSGAAYVFKGV